MTNISRVRQRIEAEEERIMYDAKAPPLPASAIVEAKFRPGAAAVFFAQTKNLSPGRNAMNESFMKWFKESGGRIPSGITLTEFVGMGRGLISSRSVEKGSLLFSVPMELVLCHRTIIAEVTKTNSRKLRMAFRNMKGDTELEVMLFLMLELSKGERSKWYPYFRVLPGKVPIPLFFSPDELVALQDDEIEHAVWRQKNHLESKWERSKRRLEKIFGENGWLVDEDVRLDQERKSSKGEDNTIRSAAAEKYKDWTTYETFLRVYSIVASRALTIRGSRYLVPLADMSNYVPDLVDRRADSGIVFLKHHRIEEVDIPTVSNGENKNQTEMGKKIKRKRLFFNIYADRRTAAGSQVFEDYGDNPNRVYLLHHGFVPQFKNPFDCVPVELPPLSPGESTTLQEDRLDLMSTMIDISSMRANPTNPSMLPKFCFTPKDGLQNPALFYLRVRELSGQAVEYCKSVVKERSAEASAAAVRANSSWMGLVSGGESAERKGREAARQVGRHTAMKCVANIAESKDEGDRIELLSKSTLAAEGILPKNDSKIHDTYDSNVDKRVYSSIHDGIRRTLRSFPTSYSEDEQSLLSNEMKVEESTIRLTENLRIALEYRLQRKRLLLELSETLSRPTELMPSAAEMFHKMLSRAEQLNKWLSIGNKYVSKLPVLRAKVKVNHGGLSLGVVSTAEIPKGSPFIVLVHSRKMTSACAFQRNSGIRDALLKLRVEFPEGDAHHELLFHLIEERWRKEKTSPWWPYLNTLPLPDEIQAPLFFSKDEIKELHGSTMEAEVIEYQAVVDRKFEAIKKRVFDTYPKAFPSRWFNRNTYRWATTMLDSRGIWIDEKLSLLPLIDLLPCHPLGYGPDTVLNEDDAMKRIGTATIETKKDGSVVGKVATAVEPGSEIFADCTSQRSHVQFLYRGLVINDAGKKISSKKNQFNGEKKEKRQNIGCVNVLISIDNAVKTEDERATKVKELKQRGIDYTENVFCLSPLGRPGGVAGKKSQQLYSFIRVLYDIPDTDVFGPRTTLGKICLSKLHSYITTVEEDEKLLKIHRLSREAGIVTAYDHRDLTVAKATVGESNENVIMKKGKPKMIQEDIEKPPLALSSRLNARQLLIIRFRLKEKQLLKALISSLGVENYEKTEL